MNEEKFYSEDEAEAILREAARLDRSGGSAQSRERLLATAAELGISEQAVREAEGRVAENMQLDRDRAEFELSRKSKFREQVASYVGTSIMLLGINFLTTGFSMRLSGMWSLWVVGIWGFSIISDMFQYYFRSKEREQVAFEKWRQKKSLKTNLTASFMPSVGPRPRIDSVLDQYFSMHASDDKIGAIKVVRQTTGLGLKESKLLVEEYYSNRGLSES